MWLSQTATKPEWPSHRRGCRLLVCFFVSRVRVVFLQSRGGRVVRQRSKRADYHPGGRGILAIVQQQWGRNYDGFRPSLSWSKCSEHQTVELRACVAVRVLMSNVGMYISSPSNRVGLIWNRFFPNLTYDNWDELLKPPCSHLNQPLSSSYRSTYIYLLYLPCVFLLWWPYSTVAWRTCISCCETEGTSREEDRQTVNTGGGGTPSSLLGIFGIRALM